MTQEVTMLTLRDVEDQITNLETEYGLKTAEFLQPGQPHDHISEDDVIEWNYLVRQQRALLEHIQSAYLPPLRETKSEKAPELRDQLDLAA